MRHLSIQGIAIAFVLGLSSSWFAVDLRNEDSRRYEVKVHDGPTTRNTYIDGNSTTLSICSSCEIEVVGIGRLKVGGSDKVTIKNGKLIRQ